MAKQTAFLQHLDSLATGLVEPGTAAGAGNLVEHAGLVLEQPRDLTLG